MKTLGDRIKRYENLTRAYLMPNGFNIIRVDGKCFSKFTKGLEKPFDEKLVESMIYAGKCLSEEIQGFKIGYHQSDEFTFVFTDTDSPNTELWFGGNIQKICSISASIFTSAFNERFASGRKANFDSRVFSVPESEVANVMIWRQRDWERNSLQMFARSYFSHSELMGKNHQEIHDMLHGIGENWTILSDQLKNGTTILKDGSFSYDKFNYESLCQKLKDN